MPRSERVQRQLDNNFTYHPPKDGQADRFVEIRAAGKAFAELVADSTPESREQSLALTAIEEAVMWANAAIARNE